MKLIIITVFFYSQALIGFTLPINEFGERGLLTPTFLGSPASKAFFIKEMRGAILSRADHTALINMKEITRNNRPKDAILTLVNDNSATSTIVISAQSFNGARNFLVPLSVGQIRELDISEVVDADSLILISIQRFSATLEINPSLGLLHEVTITPPDNHTEASSVCFNKTVIMRVKHPSGPYEDAWFKRAKRNEMTNCLYGPTSSVFQIEVFWPDQSTLHHRTNSSGYNCSPVPIALILVLIQS